MSVYDVLENLFSVGFFKGKEVKFDETKKIWRYDIQTLNIDEQKLFVDFLADEIFKKNRETGLKDRVYEYLVVDEARKFIDLKKEDEILRIIGREARKYGLGQILASQELEHIPNDIITNSAIKIILGVDESNVNSISNKLNIKKEFLFKIQPHKTALINIKTLNSKKDFYIPVKLYE
jgi:DNA helicase HerA-like ATPase